MKREVFFGISILLISFLMSCASSGTVNVFDENWPEERSAHLIIDQSMIITSFNGIPVSLERKSGSFTGFTIPEGEGTITFDILIRIFGESTYIDRQQVQTIINAYFEDVSFTHYFEAGSSYYLWKGLSDSEGNYQTLGSRDSHHAIFLVKGRSFRYTELFIQFRVMEEEVVFIRK